MPDPPEQPSLLRRPNADGVETIVGIERGMIFWGEVREAETRGSEHFHGIDNPCPWIVLSSDQIHRRLPIALVAPLSSKLTKAEAVNFRLFRIRLFASHIENYALRPGAIGLHGDKLVLTEQVRVFAHERLLGDPVAKASIQALASIEPGIKYALDLA